MKSGVPSYVNRENLLFVSPLLSNIDHFIFFGTLLGIVRDGDPINGDDDIDILVNYHHRETVIQLLTDNDLPVDFTNPLNQTPYFLQTKRHVQGLEATIDFYFFDTTNTHIVERWNFTATPDNTSQALIIPKSLIYPVKDIPFFGSKIRLPNEPLKLCEWLYGQRWKTPRTKHDDYVVKIIRNKPVLLRPLKRSVQKWVPKFLRDTAEQLLTWIRPI